MTTASRHADQILGNLHKRRSTRACYPCYRRKVRCEGGRPCQTCIERGLVDICHDDGRPRKRPDRDVGEHSVRGEQQQSQQQTLATGSHATTLTSSVEQSASPDRPNLDKATPQSGVFSAIDWVRRRVRDSRNLLYDHGAPGSVGIGKETDLSRRTVATDVQLPQTFRQLAVAAPRPDELFRFFAPFRDLVMGLYPIVTDLPALESLVYSLMVNNSGIPADDETNVGRTSDAQVAVVLSCLALGCQFAEVEAASRQDISQDLVNRANRYLQEGDCILNPSTEAVQALLLIGLAQQNLEQSNSAWMLLGLTHRLAQTLGLHLPQSAGEDAAAGPRVHLLWQAIVWQDALLSIRYDRQLLQYDTSLPIDNGASSAISSLSYFDVMHCISSIGVQLLKEPKVQLDDLHNRTQLLLKLGDVLSRVCSHLHSIQMSLTLQQRTEHLLLRIHSSLLAAEICRPGYTNRPLDETRRAFREKGVNYLRGCLHAFLDLCKFSRVPLRSWSVVQGALNTALLLAMLHPYLQDDSLTGLLRTFCTILPSDTGPPRPSTEKRRPCVGLAETRMRASEVLAYILDANSRDERGNTPGPDVADAWASSHFVDDLPMDFSLFDPNFTADLLNCDLEQEWLNDGS